MFSWAIFGFSREIDFLVKVLFKRDLPSKMRMRLEGRRERSVRDNRYIAILMISDVRLSFYSFRVNHSCMLCRLHWETVSSPILLSIRKKIQLQ